MFLFNTSKLKENVNKNKTNWTGILAHICTHVCVCIALRQPTNDVWTWTTWIWSDVCANTTQLRRHEQTNISHMHTSSHRVCRRRRRLRFVFGLYTSPTCALVYVCVSDLWGYMLAPKNAKPCNTYTSVYLRDCPVVAAYWVSVDRRACSSCWKQLVRCNSACWVVVSNWRPGRLLCRAWGMMMVINQKNGWTAVGWAACYRTQSSQRRTHTHTHRLSNALNSHTARLQKPTETHTKKKQVLNGAHARLGPTRFVLTASLATIPRTVSFRTWVYWVLGVMFWHQHTHKHTGCDSGTLSDFGWHERMHAITCVTFFWGGQPKRTIQKQTRTHTHKQLIQKSLLGWRGWEGGDFRIQKYVCVCVCANKWGR